MRGDTVVLVLKGICYVFAGATAALMSGLAQWAGTGQWPAKINWVIIVAATVGGASAQLLAFLSQSFGDWKDSRDGSFEGPGPTKLEQAVTEKKIADVKSETKEVNAQSQ